MNQMRFINRADAGRKLAAMLQEYREDDPVVAGLTCGAMVLAAEIADALGGELAILEVGKIGAPFEPDVTMGAIAPGGVVVKDERFGISEPALRRFAADEWATLQARCRPFFGTATVPEVAGRTVIVVEEAMTTGLSALAAIRALRRKHPSRVIVAAPAASSTAVKRLTFEVDAVLCLSTPQEYLALSGIYMDSELITEEDAALLLAAHRRGAATA